ncbi:conserved protein of unknown function [Pseudomonas sp. JV551A1]|uniref:Uncharacterized protein n=1 Tax=Pseudomonas inefficax TaxID=2078786 RepID=A0AAQ1P871_9PSED|nr:conserved protein of unknown function [Pseudomonas sp. JV551A1]SPO61083.1 conserved protein of unknown function [Pseudomonas inefficax]
MFSCRIALGRLARACRTTAAGHAGRACSPPDHPARLKVENVTRQVSWLAPFHVPAGAAGWRDDAFPRARSGCVDPLSVLTVAGAAAACTAFPS